MKTAEVVGEQIFADVDEAGSIMSSQDESSAVRHGQGNGFFPGKCAEK